MKRNKYTQNIEIYSEVDLHGMTDYEAEEAVINFIKISRDSGFKNVKIITGKGINSVGEPVIKKIVREILLKEKIDFSTAKFQDGGSGAFILKLKV